MGTSGSTTNGDSKRPFPVPNAVLPYWRTEPHELDEHRSTPDLPSEVEIAIVGAGFSGVTTAYHLFKDNPSPPKVLLLEARQLCSGATGRNGGHAKIKTESHLNFISKHGVQAGQELADYVSGIIAGIKALVEEEDLDCEFELRRSLDVYLDDSQGNQTKSAFDHHRKAGEEWTKTRSIVDARYAEQISSIPNAKTLVSIPACSFWPYKFVSQLLERLLKRHSPHLNFQTHTPVTSAAPQPDGSTILSTPRGNVKASKVIFATNAYTAGLLSSYTDVITPYRGMASHIAVPPGKPKIHPHLSTTYNIFFEPPKGVDYFNPRPDGGIVVGGGKWLYQDDVPSWFNNFDDSYLFPDEATAYWDNYMQRNFLGWEKSGAVADDVWVGIMGTTPDEMPHVGKVPGADNQWVLAGFNGGGMALILTAAKTVAKMVREGREFGDVAGELGVPRLFESTGERLEKKIGVDALERK